MNKKPINLIPSDMVVPAKTLRLAATLNKISTIGTILLVTIILGLISGLFYYNFQYKKTLSNIESLKSKVQSLERSEQKLVLAKDRLTKIAAVKKLDSVDDELKSFKNFESLVLTNPGSIFTEISIDSDKTETSIVSATSSSLSNVMKSLNDLSENKLTNYKHIIMSSLGFNSSSGYLVSLIFKN